VKILTLISQTIVVTAAFALIGCGSTPPAATSEAGAAGASGASGPIAIKTYPMHGKVIAVNPDKTVKIAAGPIGDWMPSAMTMDYAVKEDADRAKLTPGTTFDATAYVQGDDDWVGDVKPVAK